MAPLRQAQEGNLTSLTAAFSAISVFTNYQLGLVAEALSQRVKLNYPLKTCSVQSSDRSSCAVLHQYEYLMGQIKFPNPRSSCSLG